MSEPTRKRKKSHLIYNTVLTVVGILSVAVIIFSISGIINTVNSWQDLPDDPQGTAGLQRPNDSNPSGDTDPSTEQTQPTEPAPPPTTEPPYDAAEVAALIADADFIAAGYDYAKAISMLTAYEGYEQIPAITDKIAEYEELDSKLVVYPKPETTTHIFFHSLVVDTDRAFDGDGDAMGYHQYMTTLNEFNAMMEEMYKRGFVLVTPYDVAYENEDGKFIYGEIRLPEGKKPFIMSQDDLNYYSYMISSGNGKNEIPYWADSENDGFASRIVIGEDGYPTCEYMDAEGNILYGDYDLVPALETFIQAHPDFSYHGARAVLGFTGYEGVLGYRTKPSYEAALNQMHANGQYPWDYATEVQKAKDVAQCLKDHGWILASHSYGHPPYGERSASAVAADSKKWENTVQPIVGDCDIILYPHGSDIAGGNEKYTFSNAKFAALYEDGYRYFFNVDSAFYWNQLGDNYFRGGRRNLDGIRMYHTPDLVKDLFEVSDVWDKNRPAEAPAR